MLYFIIIVLGIALLLYMLLGGADFGAGILELFSSKKDFGRLKNITYQAMGPIWEANHVWIILVIVIFFMGFPKIYAVFSTALHIPLLLMLLGIIARGTAFTFRHYDAIKDERSQEIYTRVFAYSSFFTPLFLGISGGAVASGEIMLNADNFYDGFIAGWLNVFSVSVGLFTTAICAFLAAIYMIGEAEEEDIRSRFIRRARNTNILTVITGAMVFISAGWDNVNFVQRFINPLSLVFFGISTILLPFLWRSLQHRKVWQPRMIAGFQVSAIILAWVAGQYPDVVLLADGEHLNFYNTQAPESTLKSLTVALIVGVLVIIPFLAYLFYTFNKLRMGKRG